MNMFRSNSRSGFSLVELAIGLAVVTIMILAVSASSGIRDNARVQAAANSVQTLRSAAENYLATGKVNYVGMSMDTLKTARLLPNGFIPAKTNPWGGDYAVVPNAADNGRYDITLNSLEKDAADKLTAYFNNSASATAFDAASKAWTVTF